MCLHGESEVKKSKATHRCRRCGARSDSKGHLCKPEKIKDGKGKKKGKAEKGKKGKKKGKKKDGKKNGKK